LVGRLVGRLQVRVVAHALERLWMARSSLASDRAFCQLRHSMHFFVSNLLYYLQVRGVVFVFLFVIMFLFVFVFFTVAV
jgi:hypothetical protein